MLELPAKVQITDATTGECVDANLIELTTRIAKKSIDCKWWVLPDVDKKRRVQENDHHWQWGKRLGRLTNDKWHRALGIETSEKSIEGAILYWFNTKSEVHQDEGAVYVESLATAPHNRKTLVKTPAFRGIGETLLFHAVFESYNYGFGGRVNLRSFNEQSTIAFYENRHFEIVGYDGDGNERLPILELSPVAAECWLKSEGYLT